MRLPIYFVSAVLFAVGLVISGMTLPSKVIGFLDFFGDWDPSLAFVMGGAILAHLPAYRLIMQRSSPVFADSFQVPSRRDIDGKLIVGAALFGVGWGVAGYCPGPALSSLVALETNTIVFVAAMLTTMLAYSRYTRSVSGQPERTTRPLPSPGRETVGK